MTKQNPAFAEVTILIQLLYLILKAAISKVKEKPCFQGFALSQRQIPVIGVSHGINKSLFILYGLSL